MRKLLLTVLSLSMGLATAAQTPKADVLDIVFNDDGTVVDASAMANPLKVIGDPVIKRSPRYGMNVLCNEQELWGEQSYNNIRVPYNDNLLEAVKDGMTMEVFARPYFENGKFDTKWCCLLGGYNSGGFGIIIENSKWDFQNVIGGKQRDATYDVITDREWIHLVGVWDKEEGTCKLYVNGNLVSTAEDCTGELKLPNSNGNEVFVGLGMDFAPGSNTTSNNSFRGDIAIARIYNDPLPEERVKALYQEVENKKTEEPEHEEAIMPAMRMDADSTVLIANAEELYTFGQAVCMGFTKLNAKLEADIDFSESRRILAYDRGYGGIFDGQGHTVKIGSNAEGVPGGLFKYLTGATVRNLHITGDLIGRYKLAASLANDCSGNTLVENVSSDVNINSIIVGDGTHGGLFGCTGAGTVINNCLYSGKISSEVTNCCGGFVGWASGATVIQNSLMMGDIADVAAESAMFSRYPGNTTVRNSYYTTQIEGLPDNGATFAEPDQLASGEVCWKLNGSTAANAAWRQTIDEDAAPVLDQTHAMVLVVNDMTYNIKDEASLKDAAEAYSAAMADKADAFEAYKPLKDAMRQHAQEAGAATSIDDFVAKCKEVDADIELIEKNIKAYEALEAAGMDAQDKIEGLTNPFAVVLQTYLEEEIEPNSNYKNGSLPYITTYFNLSTEGIDTELKYIEDMLLKALSSDTPAGTDISMLVQNADFSQKTAGWEWTKEPDRFALNTEMGFSGFHYYGSYEGGFSQTLTGLTNGIYELDLNGFQMIGDDENCNYYTSVIFAGDMEMPLMGCAEDYIPLDDALAEDIGDLGSIRELDEQLIPYSMNGALYAMCQGGYYLNRVFAQVTDGTLTIGGKLYGSGRNDDWPIFCNTRLIYQGNLEEASNAMDAGLKAAVARANTIIAFEADAWGSNYIIYPNISGALRTELVQAVTDVEGAAAGEQKYALLQRFSDLFKKVYLCRKAYAKAAGDLIALDARANDFPDQYNELSAMTKVAWDGWFDGSYSAEELEQVVKNIADEMDKIEVEIPAADLMDIVFNEDGSAVDQSAAQNVVESRGVPTVVASPTLGKNVLCASSNAWAYNPVNYHIVHVSDAMKEGIENDGVTIEAMARPYFPGGVLPRTDFCTLVGSENSGGMGLLVQDSQWCFECHTGGSYHCAYSGSEPVGNRWVHIVGVWDGSEVKLYLDGTLISSASATGSYGWPVNVDRQWFGIGCDLHVGDVGQSSFSGDIAIARMYSKPLNGSQVKKLYKGIKESMTDTPEHNEGETAVTGVTAVKPANGIIYDITGRRVSRMDTKGLYIVNGKKIVVK